MQMNWNPLSWVSVLSFNMNQIFIQYEHHSKHALDCPFYKMNVRQVETNPKTTSNPIMNRYTQRGPRKGDQKQYFAFCFSICTKKVVWFQFESICRLWFILPFDLIASSIKYLFNWTFSLLTIFQWHRILFNRDQINRFRFAESQ